MLFVEFMIRLMNRKLEAGQETRTENGLMLKAITPSQLSVDTKNCYHVWDISEFDERPEIPTKFQTTL